MKPPALERVAPSSVREVSAFVRAEKDLAAWKEEYSEAAAKLAAIADVYNATLDAAEAVVRERRIETGPFVLASHLRKDNAEVLYEAVGRQRFASLGGELEPIEKLTIDRTRFDAAVAGERLGAELLARIVTWSPRYKTIKRVLLP